MCHTGVRLHAEVDAVVAGGHPRDVGIQHSPLLRHTTDLCGQFPEAGGNRGVEVLADEVPEPRGAVIDLGLADQNGHRHLTSTIGHVGGNVVHVAMQGVGDPRRRPRKLGFKSLPPSITTTTSSGQWLRRQGTK